MTEHVKTKCVSLEYPEGSSWSKEVIPLIPQLLSQPPLLHRWVHSPQLDSQRLKIEIVLFPECLSDQKSHPVYHLLNVSFFWYIIVLRGNSYSLVYIWPCCWLLIAQSSLHQTIPFPHICSLCSSSPLMKHPPLFHSFGLHSSCPCSK